MPDVRVQALAVALLVVMPLVAPAVAQQPAVGALQPLAQSGVAAPQAVPLMGRRLFGPAGEELGRIIDLLVDTDGRPVAVVVDVGGFMGLGIRRVALAWELVRIAVEPEMARLSVTITPDLVTAAPEYRPGDAASIFSPPARK